MSSEDNVREIINCFPSRFVTSRIFFSATERESESFPFISHALRIYTVHLITACKLARNNTFDE